MRSTAVAMQEGERSVDAQADKDKKKSEDKKSDKKKSDGESKDKKDKKDKDKKDKDEKSGDKGSDDGLGAGVEQLSPGVAQD
ncbi:penicillin-binding protein 1A [Brevibacterium sp. Mu109]|uniref:hypothetical protein n=1 Tax=Brevibacterium sp. Mu109 TaxID=1255669 RepID=UPI000C5911DE|nr:hypothetical protein [Brevibacterium sp. Mu109]SMX84170.1 penicillin-binding protein 1A [Brevibacterium sp. Mu109]